MNIRISVAGCLSLAAWLAALPAAAQQAQPTTPQPPVFSRPSLPRPFDPGATNNVYRDLDLQRRVWSEDQTRIALSRIPRERLERAARVGALIDQGLCGPAAQLARAEHDALMADRVPEACAARRTKRRS